MRATSGSVSAAFQSVRLALGDGLGGLVASTQKPYWTADYFSDARFQHTRPIDGAVGEEGIVAICGTPLIVESEFVGVLFAANRTARPFTREEVGLLGNLATLAAVTLVQTRALADAENAVRALQGPRNGAPVCRRCREGWPRRTTASPPSSSMAAGSTSITHAVAELLGGWAVLVDEVGSVRSATGPAPDIIEGPDSRSSAQGKRSGWTHRPRRQRLRRADQRRPRAARHSFRRRRRRPRRLGLPHGGARGHGDGARAALRAQRRRCPAVGPEPGHLRSHRAPGQRRRARPARSGVGLRPPHRVLVLVLRGEDRAANRALVMSASTATGEGHSSARTTDTSSRSSRDRSRRAREVGCGGSVGGRPVTVAGVGPMTGVDGIPAAHEEAPDGKSPDRAGSPWPRGGRHAARLRRPHRRLRP